MSAREGRPAFGGWPARTRPFKVIGIAVGVSRAGCESGFDARLSMRVVQMPCLISETRSEGDSNLVAGFPINRISRKRTVPD